MNCDACNNEATVHEVTITGGQRVERHLCEQCARKQGVAPRAPIDGETLTAILNHLSGAAEAVKAGNAAAPGAVQQCHACKLTWAQFKADAHLGCPLCYSAFEALLSPLLQRAHEGGTHHVGKTPKRFLERLRAAHAAAVASADPARISEGPEPTPLSFAATSTGDNVTSPPASTSPDLTAPTPADPAAPCIIDAVEAQRRLATLRAQLAAAVKAEQYERAAELRDTLRALQTEFPQPAQPPRPPRGDAQ
ncbi:hypothetical protein BH11PLA1_BH11PLA1_06270 [soil metagenome]